jgi:hypothetical protein
MASEQIKRQIVKSIISEILSEEEEASASTPASGPIKLPLVDIIQLIKDTKGAFFTVKFIKKDGTERIMNCRLGVKKYLHGGELPYDPVAKGLIPVWDPIAAKKQDKSEGYRSISTNTILSAKIGGKEYEPA